MNDLKRSYQQKIEAERKRRTDLVAAHTKLMKEWRDEEELSIKGSATLVKALHAKYESKIAAEEVNSFFNFHVLHGHGLIDWLLAYD